MTAPLDPAQDPDRFRPEVAGRLDPALDPDRYVADPAAAADRVQRPPRKAVLGRTGGTRETLPELLGEGSFDDKPSPYLFLLGLLGIAAFLLLVAVIFSNISP